MKRFWLITLFLLSFVFLLRIAVATITIETGATCNAGETCLFSVWNLTNSHVGACGYYTNYTVCTNEINSVATRQNSCNLGEGTLLSFFQINNTHIGDYSQFQYKLCATPSNYTCAFKTSCSSGQTCLGSAYSNANGHFGNCGYFQYQICCGNDITPPVITNQTLNSTEVTIGKTERMTANVTDDFYVSTVIVTVLTPSGSIQNYTMGLLSGNLYYLDYTALQNGAYMWTTTYANDTSNNWAIAFPNLQFFVAGINYTVSGNVFDSITGNPISGGTVTLIIKESGDSGSGTINNGVFTGQIQSYLDANSSSLTLGLISNGGGKIGYAQFILGSGPFANQIAACKLKTFQLQGYAIDPTSGQVLQSGTVTGFLTNETTTITNTTSFTSGQWSISLTACMFLGGMYPIDLILNAAGKTVQEELNVISN